MNHQNQPRMFAISAIAMMAAALLFELTMATGGQAGEKQNGESANDLMIRAHQARAVWDKFPGFQANIAVSDNGKRVAGRLAVSADGKITLDLPDSASTTWVQRQIRSLVMHRRAGGDRKYDVSFADEEKDHPLGRLIKFNEDRLHSAYRIKGDVINEVHRQMGKSKFTISVFEVTRNAEGKYLPKTYAVSFWDANTGNLKSSSTSYNKWTRVGRFDLPLKLLSVNTGDDGKRGVRQIKFSSHKLTRAPAVPE